MIGKDAAEANRHALHIIDRGVESLGICLGNLAAADLRDILKGVDLEED